MIYEYKEGTRRCDVKTDGDRSLPTLSFLEEYAALCKKHNLCLGHQDGHGSFEVEPLSDHNVEWVLSANEVVWKD